MARERVPVAGALGSYAYGWQQFKKYFLYLFLIAIIVGFASFPMWLLRHGGLHGGPPPDQVSALAQILVAAYNLLIMSVLKYGADFMYLRYMRDEATEVVETFAGFRKNYLNIVLANLLVTAIVVMGLFLLIVPGIVFAVRLSFVPYLVMDKGLEPVQAVEKSWNMTRGHSWAIFRLFLLAIPIFIGGLCLLIIGVVFALMWIGAARASLYHAVDIEEQQQLDSNGEAGPEPA